MCWYFIDIFNNSKLNNEQLNTVYKNKKKNKNKK